MRSQSTDKELPFCSPCQAVYSAAERLLVWGAGGGFFHGFQKPENYLQRLYRDQSPEMAQSRSPPETRHVAPVAATARPLPGCR